MRDVPKNVSTDDAYVVLGRDRTGWGRSGRAVVTVLTPGMVEESERRRGGG